MLSHLYIKNFTIIDRLDIDFDEGFSVVTGETGAGKSIILGALNLLLGQRAAADRVRHGEERCVIEARFDIGGYGLRPLFDAADIDYDDECTMRRELTAAGKSRAFINDTPVALSTMRTIGGQMVDIHSQHKNLLLNEADFQLGVVDTIAQDADLLNDYRQSYDDYCRARRDTENLKTAIAEAKEKEDLLRHQYSRLVEAQLQTGLRERLEQEAGTLNHMEEIKTALSTADDILNGTGGIVERLKETTRLVDGISPVYPDIKDTAQRLESCHIELKDIARDIALCADSADYDPQRLEKINNRLDTIYSLLRRHNAASVDDLITLRDNIGSQLEQIEGGDDELQELTAREEAALHRCNTLAQALTEKRRQAADTVATEMRRRLRLLDMPNVAFTVETDDKPLAADGADSVVFLFSANTNVPPMPMSQVASGGEIARVMLALKALIGGTTRLPTIIFDEIDTGVSGKTAEQMALMMQEMSRRGRQVISITHLPQIAARGHCHYRVYKEETPGGTTSSMTRLTDEQRVTEVARLLSGSDISEAAINNAKELLR